jgi:flagellar biosynthesis anti-sigma factor FlgM
MRIDASGLYPSRRAGDAAGESQQRQEATALERSGADRVSVSPQARLIALARMALDETPAVRSEVVDAARQRLQTGAVSWDGQSIAGAIIDSISDEAA